MQDISKIDKNFVVPEKIDKDDVSFYNIKENDWCLHGLKYDDTCFFRMDKGIAESVSPGVAGLNHHTSGGRLRFVTDSEYIAISFKGSLEHHMNHMPLSGSSSFDIYVDNVFYGSLITTVDAVGGMDTYREFPDRKPREILIHFPLYNPVDEVYLGLQKDATLLPATPYTYQKPVVFYGSSITQGGCASRPGCQYSAILARQLDFDHINLGFSGNAKAEPAMIDYLANLDMSVLVMDYDHNAPSVEHLQNTHEKLFLAIREKQPDLPVIMISKPDFGIPAHTIETDTKRRDIVFNTYKNAINRNDKNVYYINGETFWANEPDPGDCTVDGCHPTDHGFALMAKGIKPTLEKALKSQRSVKI